MNRKVSIVMAYQNRFSQLLFTLKTIKHFSCKENFEVIIVDYGSKGDQKASQFVEMFKFPIKVIEIEQKGWVNPCIPLNVAIRQVSGDVVIIQNPECFYCGNIIEHAIRNVDDKNYIVYSCLAIDPASTKRIVELGDSKQSFDEMQKILDSWRKVHQRDRKSKELTYWYSHPIYRPSAYHFCSAITKKNIAELGGFDERYGEGYAFDDCELLMRIRRKGLQVNIAPPESGVSVVHQAHAIVKNSRTVGGTQRNKRLYYEVTSKEIGWEVNTT